MLRGSLYTAGLLAFLSSALYAQSEVGGATLNGTITDPTGGAVAGASVTARNSATGFERATLTNADGLYDFVRLPVGNYDLTVQKQGFAATHQTGIHLNVGAVVTLDVHLELGTTQQEISVSAEVPIVETTRSQTSTVVNERDIQDLPVNGRNFLDFVLVTPGVVRDPRGGDLSFGGQRGTANSLLVDGGDSNNLFFGQSTGRAGTRNPYSFSQDAVQEFQVNSSTYNAEYGRAGAGIINVVTKSGTNNYHGTAFEFYRDKALNANTFINNSRRIRKQPYHFNQFGGNLGGPVLKDKLFFFFDYDGQRNTNPNPVFLTIPAPPDAASQQGAQMLQKYLTPYTTTLNNNVYLGKVDWNITGNQRLSVRYNANRFVGHNFENNGTNSAAEHTGDSDVTTDNVAGDYTKVFGANVVWDARLIFLRDNEPGFANSTAPEAVILQNNTTVMNIGRNNFSPRYTNTRSVQTIQTLSWVRGRHTFKAGADLNFDRIGNFFPGLFSGAYQYNSYADFALDRPFSFTQAFAGAGTDGPLTRPNVNEYGAFLQDTWRASDRLTLNYGLRYDLFDYAQPTVKNPNAALLAAGLDTSRINLDANNIGPRFGFAYRVTQSNRLVLRGGYGIYSGRTPAILTGTGFSQNGIQVQTFVLRSNFTAYPNILPAPPALGVTPNLFLFAPNYVQPQTHQWSFNVESELSRDVSLTVGYLGVRGVHLTQTRDVNLFPAAPVQGQYAGGQPLIFFRHPGAGGPARPNAAFGRISLFDSDAGSIYHGAFIQLTKRYARHFQLLTSYTLSKVIDTAPDQTSVVIPFDDSKNVQNTLLPGLDRGLGDADVRHRFIFSGVWDISYASGLQNRAARALLGGYQLAPIVNVQSGRHFSATVSGDPNNNGQTATDRPPYVGRNTIQGPGLATVDARFSRDIPLTEKTHLQLIFEGFNITNRANFNNFNRGQYSFNAATNTFTPLSNFLVRTGSADPRILQLAAKVMW